VKRVLLLLVLLVAITSLGSSLSISLFNITTLSISDGNLDYFPIMYFTYQPLDFLSLKITDYVALSHDNWEVGGYSIFKPRYYYLEVKVPWLNNDVTIDVLKSRLKRTLTEKLDGLRVGGLKFDYYGVGGYIESKSFSVGAAFDTSNNVGAFYGQLSLGGVEFGAYYENKYDQVSFDMNAKFGLSRLENEVWSALAAKTSTLDNPSYLLGCRSSFGGFEAALQYVKVGANKYDADFQTGDPNDVGENSWAAYGELGYHFGNYFGAVFFKHNSGWANEGIAPLYGMKFSYKNLSLSVANGDLDSNIMGDQKILLEWNYFHSLDFELPTFTYAKKIPTPKTEAFDKISDVYALPLGSRFKIRGIVISPKDLLGKGSMYIQDATGGIMVYGSAIPADLQVGDVVVVQGASKVWYGITEIVADSVEKVGSAQPRIIPLPSPSREYLSNLVMVVGSVVSKGEYDFIVDTGGYRIRVYIKKGTNIDLSRIVVGAKVRVTGILSIYKGELEILPRRQSDIVSI